MPNWAYNRLKLSHPDRTMIERAVTAFDAEHFLQEFIPCPQPLLETVSGWSNDPEKQAKMEKQQQANIAQFGHKDWYDWCIDNWGTKWDFGNGCDGLPEITQEGDLYTVNLSFDTAWSPPLRAYRKLEEQGFVIHALYDEESTTFCGVTAFCGEYITGTGEKITWRRDWYADDQFRIGAGADESTHSFCALCGR
jgi:hypothetical protein